MEKWEKVEFYILLVTIVVGGLVSVLDLFGILTFFRSVMSQVTLLVVSLIAGSLLLGVYNTRQFMATVLPTGAIREFESKEEIADYILFRIKHARRNVWDMTWVEPLDRGLTFDANFRDRYFGLIEEASKRGVTYRELMMFCGSPERIEKAKRLTRRTGKGYELKVLPDLPTGPPHRWQFVIIDREEVILDTVAVAQQDVVEYFRRYYDSQWASAKPIKIGDAGGIEQLEAFLREHSYERVEDSWRKIGEGTAGI
jgi:hypothetical protein